MNLYDINPNYNITPHLDGLLNLSNDTFYKAFSVYSDIFGFQIFWTVFFLIIGFGLAIQSKYNMTVLLVYFVSLSLFFLVALYLLAATVFGIMSALFGTIIIYRSLVSKR